MNDDLQIARLGEHIERHRKAGRATFTIEAVEKLIARAAAADRRERELIEANNRMEQQARDARALLRTYLAAAPRVLGFFRHVKRQTHYAVTADALAQCSTGPINEGDRVVVYQNEKGDAFVRRHEEFYDGRFETLDVHQPDTVPPSGAQTWSEGDFVDIEHDGFSGTIQGHYVTREGKRGVVIQQHHTKVVHVYGERWLSNG